MPEVTAAPFLSIVITGRNETSGANATERVLRTLRFNHHQLDARQIPHEFVFVEWNPRGDRPWLADAARQSLPGLADGTFAAYVVDPRYHDAFRLDPRLEFLEFIARNVGIRRARGTFVLTTNGDVYLGRRILARFAERTIERGIVYRAPSVEIQPGANQSDVEWEPPENENALGTGDGLGLPLEAAGVGDFILLDRAAFHALRGFNEVYRLARLGVDHNFLVKAHSNGYPIEDVGGPVYHVPRTGDASERDAHPADLPWHSTKVTYFNPESWGLADAPSRELGAHRTWIEFSWQAVPPLVDLKRVVLPPARIGAPDV